MRTPWVRGIQAAIDDPEKEIIVNMKASQTAWTDGVIVNDMLYRMDVDPVPMLAMFAKRESAEDFVDEKLAPAVRASPRMHGIIDVDTSRKAGNRKLKKIFAGGYLKLGGSNSTGLVKSTSAPVIYVEEPDDANTNVKGQGDSIKLLIDRTKTFSWRKIIYGGTPTIKDLSAIEDGYNSSDKQMYFVPCHDCGESHVLNWENVKWRDDADIEHQIYGRVVFDSAVYVCPSCGSIWDDKQKFLNVQAAETTPGAGWIATAPYHGITGFGYVSELYVPFRASRMANLLRRYLEARHKFEQGDDAEYITWVNTSEGRPYEYENTNVDSDALRARCEDYQELVVPVGGLILTCGIDIQHDRVAIIIRAWGRDQESWLVYWGEISAATSVTDVNDAVWTELEQLVYSPIAHEQGFSIGMSGVSIDSSDGQTNDAVYTWVRKMKKKYPRVDTMAIKGASDNADKEIFTTPRASIDNRSSTKASKYGLRVYMVGTNKAKDLFTARLQLEGGGAGRIHFYTDVRADYFDQITSEVKAPSRRLRGRMVWQKKSGQSNEAFDCEQYAQHAARAKKVHLKTPAQWDDLVKDLQQADLFSTPQSVSHGTSVGSSGATDDPYASVDMYDDAGGGDGWM